ncbi:valine--tRNA ligase [Streptomyces parvus]|uniref:Valine--tRNA ligase n=1 Tax=Streptomyces parvus TaxID=66428 RepID=A0A7K3RRP7_9ACTN|nr:valine--tRNA ligase [Streptomyces parvus]NEC17896.1 valine--tRNA ligase [Streptomyces parvus]
MTKKQPPPIPVIGASQDSSREAELLAWEEKERARREQPMTEQAPPTAPLAVVPAPAAEPAATGAVAGLEPAPAAVETVAPRFAPGYLKMPDFSEPDTVNPAERLEFYSQGIFAVQYAAKANHERAEQQKLIGLGLRLQAIKNEELHKHTGFETFGALTDARFGIKKHQANNILRVLGVAQALEDVTTQELKERPLRVLVPILDTHGADAVRETWAEAARHGNVTDTALKDAANFLGYAPPTVQPVLQVEPPKPKPVPAALGSEPERVVERLRALAEKDLPAARREAAVLQAAVRELVEELDGNLETG